MDNSYFVFISYSSFDDVWAVWLRHELEHYHLPASFNGRTDVRDNLRKVFRDRDELSAGPEWDKQVFEALKNSENLIVICSPHAKESDPINKEVQKFIELGKEDHIFPFIVEGDSPDKCFPPSLCSAKLAGDVNKDGGRDAAFVKVVAGMLRISFPSLWERYEKEKAEEERRNREQRDRLLIVQSRFLSEKANNLTVRGDARLSCLLSLEALPKNIDAPDRPYTVEAEQALRLATIDSFVPGLTDYCCSVSPDGSRLASLLDRYIVKIWDTSTGAAIKEIDLSHLVPKEFDSYQQSHNTHFHSVSFANRGSHDGLILTTESVYFNTDDYSGFSYSEAFWYDFETEKLEVIFEESTNGSSIQCPLISADNSFAVYLSSTNYNDSNNSHCMLYVVKIPSRDILLDLRLNNFHSVTISPDNQHIAICSNNDIHVLNITDGSYPHKKRINGIRSCVYDGTGASLFLNCSDDCIRRWDLISNDIYELYTCGERIKQMKVSRNYLVISSYSGSMFVLEQNQPCLLLATRKLEVDLNIVSVIDTDDKAFITYEIPSKNDSGKNNKEIRFWYFLIDDNSEIKAWHDGPIQDYSYCPDKSLFVSVSEHCIVIWDTIIDRLIRKMIIGDGIEHCGVSKKNHLVVYSTWEGVWLLDFIKQSLCPLKIGLEGMIVTSPIIFMPDESCCVFIADNGNKQALYVFNIVKQKTELIITPPNEHFFGGGCIDISPNGKMIASSSIPEDPSFLSINIWDSHSGKLLYSTLFEDGGFNCSLRFTDDGRKIIVAQSNVWDYTSTDEIHKIENPDSVTDDPLFTDGYFLKKHLSAVPLQELINQTQLRLSSLGLTLDERKRYYLE